MGAGARGAQGARGANGAIAGIAFLLAIFVPVVGHPFRGADVIAQTPPPRTPGQLPDGPGKATYESVCSLCHPAGTTAGKQWTREQWDLKVIEMLQEEPDVTADERKQIVDYLASVFKPGGRIYINLAGTKDLAKLLDIPLDEAERIVTQRRDKGPFASVDAVKSVAGVDAAKIDAKAAEMEF
jgi:hypothetical protein